MKKHLIVAFNGISGEASFDRGSIVLKGPWASHTGYYHAQAPVLGENDCVVSMLYEYAERSYNTHKAYSFVVADEAKQYGWKRIKRGITGDIEVRLPCWHKGAVVEAIEDYGMVCTCKHNKRWAFPAGSGVTLDTAKQLLRPILTAGTRFASEAALAEQIDQAALSMGFPLRGAISLGQAQQALL